MREGDIACLVGFAGSGKSTLLGAVFLAKALSGYFT